MKILTVRLYLALMLLLSSLTLASSYVYWEAFTLGQSVAWQSNGELVDASLQSPFKLVIRSSRLKSDFIEPGTDSAEKVSVIFPHYLLVALITLSLVGLLFTFKKNESKA